MTQIAASIAALAAVLPAGCGQSAVGTTASTASAAALATTGSTVASASSTTDAAQHAPARAAGRGSSGLIYSDASAQIVQAGPAPGSCHAIGTGLYSRPDPRCTPGALNPAVTQATIGSTICRDGWTDTIRPPESVTEAEKRASMAAYGDTGPISSYEYDHFVPLGLGGAVNDPRNLWPEPGASPNPKDAVEDELNQKVCDGKMTLAQAQRAIVTNWVALAAPPPAASTTTPVTNSNSGASARSAGGVHCTVTASYNGTYHDYDVYVTSNQPDQAVTVTSDAGHSKRWHTNSSGSADVYFDAGGAAAGQTITARVGDASCSTTL